MTFKRFGLGTRPVGNIGIPDIVGKVDGDYMLVVDHDRLIKAAEYYADMMKLRAQKAEKAQDEQAIRCAVLEEAATLNEQWGNARNPDSGGNALRNAAIAIRDLKSQLTQQDAEKVDAQPVAWGIFYQGVMQQGWGYNEEAARAIAKEDYPKVKVEVKPLYVQPDPAMAGDEISDEELFTVHAPKQVRS